MRNGLIFSGLLHLGVMAALYVGVPQFADPLTPAEAISVEVVTADEITGAEAAEPEAPEPEPEPVEQTPPPAPKAPEPPTQQAKAEPAPPPEPEPAPPKPEPQPAAVPPPPEPVPRPKEKPAPPPEPDPDPKPETESESPGPVRVPPEKPDIKPAEKPEPAEPENRLSSILKNVLKDKDAAKRARESNGDARAETQQAKTQPRERVTASERLKLASVIRQQVERCWLVPIGAKDAENLAVELRVQLNPDGSLQRAEIVDVARLTGDPFYRTVAESALRAVRKCEPFQKLPVDRYDVWKDLKLTFNPEKYGT